MNCIDNTALHLTRQVLTFPVYCNKQSIQKPFYELVAKNPMYFIDYTIFLRSRKLVSYFYLEFQLFFKEVLSYNYLLLLHEEDGLSGYLFRSMVNKITGIKY